MSSLSASNISFFAQIVIPLALGAFLTSCEPSGDGIVDHQQAPPRLATGSVSPSTINTDTINVGPERLPEDILSLSLEARVKVIPANGPLAVRYSVYRDKLSDPAGEGLLFDNGLSPDLAAGDSLYTGLVQFQITRSVVGTFAIEIVAESGGLESTAHLSIITIERLNKPPVLSQFLAPDTVRTGEQGSFIITVRAIDPDGQADIKSVTRRTPSNLVLPLNDSGVNGDAVAGDGTYTETVSLNPPPPPGSYQFTFQALDRSNASSNIITHTIVVLP